MIRTFTYEVIEGGYKIFINGDSKADIEQMGYMPYPDTVHTVGTPEYYAGCAENDIAQMQKSDADAENYVTDMEKTQEDVVNAMMAIAELYEMILG